jgi:hypothetical protein
MVSFFKTEECPELQIWGSSASPGLPMRLLVLCNALEGVKKSRKDVTSDIAMI